eukprot:1181228-Prorocentrum_minimum.AAC.2
MDGASSSGRSGLGLRRGCTLATSALALTHAPAACLKRVATCRPGGKKGAGSTRGLQGVHRGSTGGPQEVYRGSTGGLQGVHRGSTWGVRGGGEGGARRGREERERYGEPCLSLRIFGRRATVGVPLLAAVLISRVPIFAAVLISRVPILAAVLISCVPILAAVLISRVPLLAAVLISRVPILASSEPTTLSAYACCLRLCYAARRVRRTRA